jgi:hypothetical protein
MADTWEERMAQRARERAQQLAEVAWQQLPVENRMCMTGDGNMAAGPDTALCIHCQNRPYGERKLRASDVEQGCQQCWGRWLIWVGNAWAIAHIDPPRLQECKHSCHADEVWLASMIDFRAILS